MLLALINQILDLSKIESGQISLDEKAFDLYRLLDELKDMFSPSAEKKRLSMDVECASDVPRNIVADDMKLRQVLINLIGNAVKFTEKGRVSLQVKKARAGSDSSSSKIFLKFAVKDTGPGISPDETDQLFKAFSQTQIGKESHQGTGLGLSISQKFVMLMGDAIQVNSEPGNGATFSFVLGARVSDPAVAETQEACLHVKSDKKTGKSHRKRQQEAVAALPAPLIAELKEAATYCELDAVNRIIVDVRTRNPSLADELEHLTGEFDFDGILALIKEKI